jgi:hypothetical protein
MTPASKVVDGDASTYCRTNSGVGEWWKVFFNTESYVSVVKVQSKTGTAFSLNQANVFVGNTLCG